jgi:flagellar biogenesis protein FliO
MEFGRQFWSAALAPALFGAAWWRLRRGAWRTVHPGKQRRLEPVARLALSPQHTLHLVRVDGRTVLLACSPASCAVLEGVATRQEDERPGDER